MQLPSVTKAQIVALATAAIGVAVALGAPIDDNLQNGILVLVGVIASILLGADAHIRAARNKVRAESISTGNGDPADK